MKPLKKPVAGSLSAALCGWIVLIESFLLLGLIHGVINYSGLALLAISSGVFVFFVWVAILLPIYFQVPVGSPIWRWPISTLIGGASGWIIMGVFFVMLTSLNGSAVLINLIFLNGYCWFAALCGGATGLFAGLTARHFLQSSKHPL